ncbi:TadE family type IV pilus minor pilin [Sphaerisporangium sp. B11E5]|uniref:TadE family type IV pilus minor pilin n=1 Tax=Sphaerisporangium sp. B11E5 TaxID=3153563 RepID=UPI00325EE87B
MNGGRAPGRCDRLFRLPRARGGGSRAEEEGSVTAEMAVGLPTLALVLGGALWAVAVVGVQLECVDAARTGARAAARGESLDAVRRMAGLAAPAGAVVSVTRDAELSRVTISATVRPVKAALLPGIVIRADATAATEPGAEETGP